MIVIGVDESGVGAVAGPASVCAAAAYHHDSDELWSLGVTDSKRLSDRRRRAMIDGLSDVLLFACTELIEVEDYNRMGKQPSWRFAMIRAMSRALRLVDGAPHRFIIDGLDDPNLVAWLQEQDTNWTFAPKADLTVPAVSAASIIAKTARNDCMVRIHDEYPEYGFAKNTGYKTPDHNAALKKYGRCRHHRLVKNVRDLPLRAD